MWGISHAVRGLRAVRQFHVRGPFPGLSTITEHGTSQRREFFEDKF